MKRWLLIAPVCALGLWWGFQALREQPPAIEGIEMLTPGKSSIVMGKIVPCEIRVVVAPGLQLESAQLPQGGSAASEVLELRSVKWSSSRENGAEIYRIELTYQVFKGVRGLETVTVPEIPLYFSRGGQRLEVIAPSWTFTLKPLIAPELADESVILRGDQGAKPYSTASHQAGAMAFFSMLTALMLYTLWHLGLPPFAGRRRKPFARARRAISRLSQSTVSAETYEKALRLIHGALNQTAGKALYLGELDEFCRRQPQFAEMHPLLAEFFEQSRQWFYVRQSQGASGDAMGRLNELCRMGEQAEVEAFAEDGRTSLGESPGQPGLGRRS